jgi:glycosyltransferase involved in cell wall biosynthesis
MKGKIILFLDNSSTAAWRFRSACMKHLLVLGYDVVCMAPCDGCVDQIKQAGITYQALYLRRGSFNPLDDLRTCWQMFKQIKRLRPDWVFSYSIKPNMYAALIAKCLSIPLIAVVPGAGYAFTALDVKAKLIRACYGFSLRLAREVWFLNQDDKDDFIKLAYASPEASRVLPGEGIDAFSMESVYKPNDHVVLGFAGRMLSDKGLQLFAEVARRCQAEGLAVDFVLAGPIDEHNPSGIDAQLIASWEAEGILTYKGFIDDMPAFFAGLDALVLPSFREGMSRVLLEAAAYGLPLLASNVRGCKEIIGDALTGFLFESQSADALFDAIERFLLCSKDKRIAMGRAGQARVRQYFDQGRVLDVYQEVLCQDRVELAK